MSEIAIQVENTKAFINAEPVALWIYRDTYISDGAGGKKKSGSPVLIVANIPFRMINQSHRSGGSNQVTQTTNGALERPHYVLLGTPGLPLQRKDFFEWHGDTWEIDSVHDSPAYEFKADVKIRKDL